MERDSQAALVRGFASSEFITVVTGSPRCGTSLMMRMLFHGGMAVHAQSYVSYEHSDAAPSDRQTWAWLAFCYGKAVKILEPLYCTPPDGHAYKFILMQRNATQQAKSFMKFNKLVSGEDLTDDAEEVLTRSFEEDYPKMMRLLERLGPLLVVQFEEVLEHPDRTANSVQDFLWGDAAREDTKRRLDVQAMVQQVVRRDSACLPIMLEEVLIRARGVSPAQIMLTAEQGGRKR